MPRVPRFIPKYHATRQKWYFVTPVYSRRVGKDNKPAQKFHWFESKGEAEESARSHRRAYQQGVNGLAEVDPHTVTANNEFVHHVRELGFSNARALEILSNYQAKENMAPTFREVLELYVKSSSDSVREGKSSTWNWVYKQVSHLETENMKDMDFNFWRKFFDGWYRGYDTKIGTVDSKNRAFNKLKSRLKGVYDTAIEHKYVSMCPFITISHKDGSNKDIHIVTPEQLTKFLDDVTLHHPDLIPYFIITFFAGVRPKEEMIALRWDKIHWSINKIEVYSSKTKKKREIEIEPCLAAWLKPFKTARMRGAVLGNYNTMTKIRKKIYMGNYQPENKKIFQWENDISRHSYATYYEAHYRHVNGNLERLRVNMGHTNYTTIDQYYKSYVKEYKAKDYWMMPTPQQIKRLKAYLERV